MPSRDYYHHQAETLRKLAGATSDRDEAFSYNLRAIEFDQLADDIGSGQVRQRGTHPPAPPPFQDQPAQQQQQAQTPFRSPRKGNTG